MTTIKSWLGWGGLFLFVALVIYAPARLIQWFVPDGVTLQASQYQGSLWNGQALGVVLGAQGAYVAVDALNWQLKPFLLLLFSPGADVQIKANGSDLLTGELQWLGGQQWSAENTELTLPAALVGRYAGGYQLAGQLSVQLNNAQSDGARLADVSGTIVWQGARFNDGSQWLDMGSLGADLFMQGEAVELRIFDISGPLDVDGEVLIQPSGSLSVDGLIGLPPQSPESFIQGLSLLGERQKDGKFRIEFEY